MSRIPVGNSIRKNILLSKKLYYESKLIAEEEGLSYTDYVRHLLVLDIKRREAPAEIPKEKDYQHDYQDNLNLINTKKRKELIRIMHDIRKLI